MIDVEAPYRDIVFLPFGKKAETAQNAFFALCKELDCNEDLAAFSAAKMEWVRKLVAVSIKGDCSDCAAEWQFYQAVFGPVPLEEYRALVYGGAGERLVQEVDGFVDSLSDEGKLSALALSACFLSCDGSFLEKEEALLRRLFR